MYFFYSVGFAFTKPCQKDALRSLIISQRLLGTREIAVYHHIGYGMVTFRGPEFKRLVKWATTRPSLPKSTQLIFRNSGIWKNPSRMT
jgi:carbonic anhydrase